MTPRWLLIEDDDVDVLAVRRALRETGEPVELEQAVDGEDGLAALKTAASPFSLILLDLNMPRMGGLEFLSALKSQIDDPPPVVVLTTSADLKEIQEAFRLGAVACFTKKLEYDEFVGMIKKITALAALRRKTS